MSNRTLLHGSARRCLGLPRSIVPIFCLFLILLLTSSFRTSIQPRPAMLTMHLVNAPLQKAFALIKRQSDYRVIYDNSILKSAKPVTISVERQPVHEVLPQLFRDQPFDYRIEEETIILTPRSSRLQDSVSDKPGNAKDTLVSGTILADSTLTPLAGATISIRGTNRFTTTDSSGKFRITVPGERVTLLISYVGYSTQSIVVDHPGRSSVRVVLRKTPQEMEEVQIISTGYQDIEKKNIPGAFSTIDNKTLNQQTGTNILQRLNNVTSGLLFNIGKVNNNPQNTTNISIRGLSTINGPLDPLIVLDNFIYEGDINNINPNDIEKVTVLKDAVATSIWGARAGNGVIVITTKKGRFNQRLKIDLNADVIVTQKPDIYYPSQISPADEIDVEQYIFNKGYFDDQIYDTYQYLPLTPAVKVFLNRQNGLISAADSASQINALKSVNSLDQYNKYFYQTAITQQYALNLRGGGNNVAWLISGTYDKSNYTLKNDYDKVNLRFSNSYRPIKNIQIDAGVYYTSSKAVSGLSTNNFQIAGRNVPYLKFADDNGNPLPIDRYNSNFTDTAGAGNLLDWKFYPLNDYKHDRTTVSLQEFVADLGLNIQILSFLKLAVNYQYQKQSSNTETLADLQSFYARDLINNFSDIDYVNNKVNYIIPKGDILDQSFSNINSQNFRGQFIFNKSWENHAVSAIAGTEAREMITGGNSVRY
ncbi:MAG TPA: carboxypeptidase-like regulatory domain-containing protein, partial [Puia sp.]|nr:carboxypeptidase-like regulatory domain-containing protein [Puia sp.]